MELIKETGITYGCPCGRNGVLVGGEVYECGECESVYCVIESICSKYSGLEGVVAGSNEIDRTITFVIVSRFLKEVFV